MLQSIGVSVLIALVAVNFVECRDLTFDYGPALDCRSSPAAASPTLAKKMCRELIAKVKSEPKVSPDDELEEAAFGCACGLSTHNLWYKGLTTNVMVRMLTIAEQFVEQPASLDLVGFKGKSLGNTYDKFRFVIKDKYLRSHNPKYFWNKFAETYYTGETGGDLSLLRDYDKLTMKIAQNSCHHLLNNEFFKDFIKPSLEAIKSTMGKRADHAVIVGQADLLRVMNFANFCTAFVEAKSDSALDY